MRKLVQPVTFYVPTSAAEPIEVDVQHSGLRMVLVNREAIHLLEPTWEVLGVYFLLGPADEPDRYRAYVGEVGRRSLLIRIKEHAAQKRFWNRALLITSSSDSFNSAEIGWLEGRLYDVLNNAVAAELVNRGRPGDDSIDVRARGVLERYVEPIMAALRACGASPDTADQKPPPQGGRRRPSRYSESVRDLIEAGLLKAGTRLVPLRRGLDATALVLDDGALEVGGVRYEHVSPAAMAVSGGRAEPGWDFWGAPSGDGSHVPLAKLRQRLREGHAQGRERAPAPAEAPVQAPGRPTTGEGRRASPAPRPSARHPRPQVLELIEAGDLRAGERLHAVHKGTRHATRLLPDGRAEGIAGGEAGSLSTVAGQVTGGSVNGWTFWSVERDGQLVRLADVRARRGGNVAQRGR